MDMRCMECGNLVEIYFQNFFYDDEIRWMISSYCIKCHRRYEKECFDDARDEVINTVLNVEASKPVWELSLLDSNINRVAFMSILKNQFDFLLEDIKRFSRGIENFKLVGTYFEMRKFALVLMKKNMKVEIKKANF